MADREKFESDKDLDTRERRSASPEPRWQPNGSHISLTYVVIAIILISFIAFRSGVMFPGDRIDILSTSEFMTAVQEGRVKEATYKSSNGDLSGLYWEHASDLTNADKAIKFKSSWVGSDKLADLMNEHKNDIDFKVDTSDGSLIETILVSLIPALLLVAVFVYFLNQIQTQNGQAMSFGKAKAKVPVDMRPKTKFADVAGIDEAVEELREVKDFLSEPERYYKMGAKIPRGVLLVGPPGTGKTLLAKAVAGEAGVPFFSISGSDFVEMFVGVGASRVRHLFQEAKEVSPSIIFVDEIDAVGRQRGAGLGGGHDEREQTLNQLLVEMDGFEDNSATILIAATNRPDILDPALLRPGRFDRQITVDRPDVKGREKILRVHAQGKPVNASVQYENLAKLTPGFTGADLANLMNEAALLAARKRRKAISMAEIEEAMERVLAGPERKSRVMSEKERTTIAYHESGHALVGHLLDNADPVHKITIVSRGQALGYTMSLPEEDHFLETRGRMLDELATLLAGRVAEELFCNDITTGASNDLERVTKTARAMVMRYGMSELLGTQVFGEAQHQVFLGRDYADRENYSQETAKRIDDEVSRIVFEAHERAQELLSQRAQQMHQMASVLLERETVDGAALEALLNDTWDSYVEREAAELEAKKRRAAAARARRSSDSHANKQAHESGRPSAASARPQPVRMHAQQTARTTQATQTIRSQSKQANGESTHEHQ